MVVALVAVVARAFLLVIYTGFAWLHLQNTGFRGGCIQKARKTRHKTPGATSATGATTLLDLWTGCGGVVCDRLGVRCLRGVALAVRCVHGSGLRCGYPLGLSSVISYSFYLFFF